MDMYNLLYLAFFGVSSFFKTKENLKKRVYISSYIKSSMFLIDMRKKEDKQR